MLKYAIENGLKIPSGLDIWCTADPVEGDPIDRSMITLFNNTGKVATACIFPIALSQPSERNEDLFDKALQKVTLDLDEYTATFRMDVSFKIGVSYIKDINGRKIAPEVPLVDHNVPDGYGAFNVEFTTRCNTTRATLVPVTNSPELREGQVVIYKKNAKFDVFIGFWKNGVLFHGEMLDRSAKKANIFIPEQYAVRWYSYRERGHEEADFGGVVEVSPGQVCWLIRNTDGSVNPEVTDNTELLYVPTENELNIYEDATCEDPNIQS